MITFKPAKKMFGNIPLGFRVRRDIGRLIIYRVRRGNGYYNSTLGELYQDKYPYFIPASIRNIEGQPARDALSAAVSNWKIVLTQTERDGYNKRAMIKGNLSGFNLYVGEYIKAHT